MNIIPYLQGRRKRERKQTLNFVSFSTSHLRKFTYSQTCANDHLWITTPGNNNNPKSRPTNFSTKIISEQQQPVNKDHHSLTNLAQIKKKTWVQQPLMSFMAIYDPFFQNLGLLFIWKFQSNYLIKLSH